MNRTLSLATIFAATLVGSAVSEEANKPIVPGTGPTSTMSDQVPQMKMDAEAIDAAGVNGDKRLPAAKAMGDAVPSMRPGDAVSGQSDSKSSPNTGPSQAAASTASTFALTVQEEKAWFNKPVFSSDGQKLGEVVAFQRDAQNNVVGMHADIGGFLGYGQTSVALRADQFKLSGDRVLLDLTSVQAKELPKVQI